MTDDTGRNGFLPTNEDTSGPYFPIYFQDGSFEDLTRFGPGVVAHADGPAIVLRGRVVDRHGDPATGAVLEFWQANAKGVYRTPATRDHADLDPWFDGYGRLRAHDGEYAFRTVMPGASGGRAPTVTITIFSDGISRIVTQMFFPDQAANDDDPLLNALDERDRARLIARHDGRAGDGAEVYLFDIVMAGEDETPFFDDLES